MWVSKWRKVTGRFGGRVLALPGTSPAVTAFFRILAISMASLAVSLRQARGFIDQFLRRYVQQLVLGRAAQHAFAADFQQHRHGERRDAVEPAIVDAALGALQEV